jgi:hypothetical protein
MRHSVLTPALVPFDSRQQPVTVRLANACKHSKLKVTYNSQTSGTLTSRVIKQEHERCRKAETMRWPNPDKEPAEMTVILRDDTVVNREAI